MYNKNLKSIVVLLILLFLFSCSKKQEQPNREVIYQIDSSETEDADSTETVYVDSFGLEYDKWEVYQPLAIDSIAFSKAYRKKRELFFKGVMDFDRMVDVSYDWGDTIMRSEYTHEIFISNFSKKGFDFSLAAHATGANMNITSSCHISDKAVFSSYNIAQHGKSEDDENYYEDERAFTLTFTFYKDTLVIVPSGCHGCYCGAACEMGRVFVLEKEE